MFRLKVPYDEKDDMKAMARKYGAVRWISDKKIWEFDVDELPGEFRRWCIGSDADYMPASAAGRSSAAGKTAGAASFSFSAGLSGTASIPPDGIASAAGKSAEGSVVITADSPYKTVTYINRMIKSYMQDSPVFQNIMVRGEVTNYSGPNKGNYYFSIKDENCILDCFMWGSEAAYGLKVPLEKGKEVAITGTLEFYDRSGKCQLHARKILEVGEGADNLALLQLTEKLKAEGLFDIEHKKQVPKHPDKIGIVTSKDGQAIRDIYATARSRNPYAQLILYHVNVQGVNAVPSIIKGIRVLDGMGLGVIIVGRGGGSDEELKIYNSEELVRTVFEARTPIISAVGHEGHVPLIDNVADLRVPTPTAAAQYVCPNIMEEIQKVDYLCRSMKRNVLYALSSRKDALAARRAVLEKNSPVQKLKERQNHLENASALLKQNIIRVYEGKRHQFEMLAERLNGLSPTAKLVRGFGYISLKGRPLTSVGEVNVSDEIEVRISDGTINATVNAKTEQGKE